MLSEIIMVTYLLFKLGLNYRLFYARQFKIDIR